MYSNFHSIESSQTSQSRSIKSFLQCTAEYQLTSFITALTQSQSTSFITAHINQNIKMLIKLIKKQLKHLISTLIKTSLIFYTAEFYSSTNQLQLRVKKIAD